MRRPEVSGSGTKHHQGGDAVKVELAAACEAVPPEMSGVPVEIKPWAEETEAADMRSVDAGIMPLPDASWERGKCGYKLIQYMACAKPIVASPTPT